MMTVRKSSFFQAPVEKIFDKLQRLETLQYIAYPYATFEPVDGKQELIWEKDTIFSFRFKLFGVIPFGVHTIKVIWFSLEEGIFTNETNPHVPMWNHEIVLERVDENTTKYTDIVEINAGWKTVFVYVWAVCFYSHRQRKWKKLLDSNTKIKSEK